LQRGGSEREMKQGTNKLISSFIVVIFAASNITYAAPVKSALRATSTVGTSMPSSIADRLIKSSSSGEDFVPVEPGNTLFQQQIDIARQLEAAGRNTEAAAVMQQAQSLLRYSFFETEYSTFERIRRRTASSDSLEKVNIPVLVGYESPAATDPTGKAGPVDLAHMGSRRIEDLRERGMKIPSALGFSAGGLSTRSGGVMNAGFRFAIPELDPDNPDQLYGFMQLKIAEAMRSRDELRQATGDTEAEAPVYIMGSYQTEGIIREQLERNDFYGLGSSDISLFTQGIQVRFTPSKAILEKYLSEQEDKFRNGLISQEKIEALERGVELQRSKVGEPLRKSNGMIITNPPGHWDFIRWLILSGKAAELSRKNIPFIFHANMNNTAARISPEMKGLFAEMIDEARRNGESIPVAAVGVCENRGERGGFLLFRINKDTGKRELVILDKQGWNKEFKDKVNKLSDEDLKEMFPYFHSASILFSIDGLIKAFGLEKDYDKQLTIEDIANRIMAKEPQSYVDLKETEDIDHQGRRVILIGAQIERNIGDITHILPYVSVIIDRDNEFVPIKTTNETDPETKEGRSRLKWTADANRDKLPYLFDKTSYSDKISAISNVISGLLRSNVSDAAFVDNISLSNRALIKKFLLDEKNRAVLEVLLGIRAASVQDRLDIIYDENDKLTDFGKDFLYFLRVIGYKTGKKINIKRMEMPEGTYYYIYDIDILRYHAYTSGYSAAFVNMERALEDILIFLSMANKTGVFFDLATEPLPGHVYDIAENVIKSAKTAILKGENIPFESSITLAPLWVPSYKRPMGLHRVLALQTGVLDEFGHKNLPIAVASNANPKEQAQAMKDEEVDWINKKYFGARKTADEIRSMTWGALDRLVVQDYSNKGYYIVYIDWDVRDAIVKAVVDALTERYKRLYREGKLREDISLQFDDIDSIRAKVQEVLNDQFAANISGIRNLTIMLSQGFKMVSVDDDSMPVMRVAKRRVLEDILEKRRQAVEAKRVEFFKELSDVSGQKIESEADFAAYMADRGQSNHAEVDNVIRRYYFYKTGDGETAIIPTASGQVVTPGIDNTTRFNALLDSGLPAHLVVSEDAILVDADDADAYAYDEYTVDYLSVLNKALGSFAVSPETGAIIVDKDKRGFAGTAFTANIDDIRFLRNQCATTHFNHDRDKSGDAQIDSFLARGATDPLTLQEAALKAIFLDRPEGVTALLDPQENTADSNRIFMCMNMFSFDASVYPIPTIGQLLRIEEPYFNYLLRAITGRLMSWTRTVGGHHRIPAGTRPNIPLQVAKEHTAMTAWPALNRVTQETMQKFGSHAKYDDRVDYRERMMYLGRRMIEEAKAYEIPSQQKEALLKVQETTIDRINKLTAKAEEAFKRGDNNLGESLNMLAGEFMVEFLPPSFKPEQVEGRSKLKRYLIETTFLMDAGADGSIIFTPTVVVEDMIGDEKQKEDRKVWFELNTKKSPIVVARNDFTEVTQGGQANYMVTLQNADVSATITLDIMPQTGTKRYISGINESVKENFIAKTVADVKKQMRSDGETLLFWPDVMDIASQTGQFKQARATFTKVSEKAFVKSSSAGHVLSHLSDYDAEHLLAKSLLNYKYLGTPAGIIEAPSNSQAIVVYSDSLKESPALQELIRQAAGDTRMFYLVNKEDNISAYELLNSLNIDKNIFERHIFNQNTLTADQLALMIASFLRENHIKQGRVFAGTKDDLSAWSKQDLIEALVLLLTDKRFEIISDYSQQHKEYIRTHKQALVAA
jgi:hypothetical protein